MSNRLSWLVRRGRVGRSPCSTGEAVSADRRLLLLLALVLGVAGVVVLSAPVLYAQADDPPVLARGAELRECIGRITQDRVESDADPLMRPGQNEPIVLAEPRNLLNRGVDCAHDFARDVIRPIGRNLLAGLALIIVVWTGVMFMFSGRFDMAQIINLVFLIGFAFMVMDGFDDDNWWGDNSFPELIFNQGVFIGGGMIDAGWADFSEAVARLFEMIALTASGGGGGGWTAAGGAIVGAAIGAGIVLTGGLGLIALGAATVFGAAFGGLLGSQAGVVRSLIAALDSVMVVIVVLLSFIPAVILYCAYLWAYVGFMVAVILGPLFVPWMLIPQLDWLFWSWMKSLVKLAVHLMVAGVLFLLCAQFATIPVTRLIIRLFQLGSLGEDGGLMEGFESLLDSLLAYLPLLVLMFMMCGKTGELTAMLTEGTGMPASGAGGLATRLGRTGIGQSAGGAAMRGAGTVAGVATAGVATAASALSRLGGRGK